MAISKINSIPAFKGSIRFKTYEIENGRSKYGEIFDKTILADNIKSIEEDTNWHRKCTITTKDNKKYIYTYDYPDYRSERCKDGMGKLTDLNTVLNAYMAAKMSDDDFVVKL